jgi:hypothetical protein
VLRGQGCAFTLSAEESAWIAGARARRTGVPPASPPADRASLEWLAALRDRACACGDLSCIDRVEAELDAGSSSMRLGPDALAASRDAASAMIDEITACGRQLRFKTP